MVCKIQCDPEVSYVVSYVGSFVNINSDKVCTVLVFWNLGRLHVILRISMLV